MLTGLGHRLLAGASAVATSLLVASSITGAAGIGAAAGCTSDDVVRIYRHQLERDPESDGAVAGRVGRPGDQVEDEIASSPEARALRAGVIDDLLRQGRPTFPLDPIRREGFWGG